MVLFQLMVLYIKRWEKAILKIISITQRHTLAQKASPRRLGRLWIQVQRLRRTRNIRTQVLRGSWKFRFIINILIKYYSWCQCWCFRNVIYIDYWFKKTCQEYDANVTIDLARRIANIVHHTADPPKPWVTNLYKSRWIKMRLERVGRTNDSQVNDMFQKTSRSRRAYAAAKNGPG